MTGSSDAQAEEDASSSEEKSDGAPAQAPAAAASAGAPSEFVKSALRDALAEAPAEESEEESAEADEESEGGAGEAEETSGDEEQAPEGEEAEGSEAEEAVTDEGASSSSGGGRREGERSGLRQRLAFFEGAWLHSAGHEVVLRRDGGVFVISNPVAGGTIKMPRENFVRSRGCQYQGHAGKLEGGVISWSNGSTWTKRSLTALRVMALAARGFPEWGSLGAHCTCSVVGSPGSQLRAEAVDRTEDLVLFHFSGELADCAKGDAVAFSVFGASTAAGETLLGEATLASEQFWASGFEGELPLRGGPAAAAEAAAPHLHVVVVRRGMPPEGATRLSGIRLSPRGPSPLRGPWPRSLQEQVQVLRQQAVQQGEALRRLGAAYEALSAEHEQMREEWRRVSEFERHLARSWAPDSEAAGQRSPRAAFLPPGGQGLPPGTGTAGLALIAEMKSLRKVHHQTRMEFKAMREEFRGVRQDLEASRGDAAELQSWRRRAERELESARADAAELQSRRRLERTPPSTPGSPSSRPAGTPVIGARWVP